MARRGLGWWAANLCLVCGSAVFLLPFLWLVLTAFKPVEQTMKFDWLPRACRAPVAGKMVTVVKEREITEASLVVTIRDGKRSGERLLIARSVWDGASALVEEQDADQVRLVRRAVDVESEVLAGWWRVREKSLRKYAERQPRWECVPPEAIEEGVRFWWENFALAVEYLADTEEVPLQVRTRPASSPNAAAPLAPEDRFSLSWAQPGPILLTRYDALTFRSQAATESRLSLLARDDRGTVHRLQETLVVPAGTRDHEVSLKRARHIPDPQGTGRVTDLWLEPTGVPAGNLLIGEPRLIHYRATFWTYLANTLTVALLGVIGTVLSSSLVAYGFSRIQWPGRDRVFWIVLATMMVPFPVLMVPMFGVFRELGWVGTLKPLWVPAFFGSAFNIFLLRQFFLTIPQELSDAARIDGCSEFGIYWRIILPLSKPALAVVALFHFLWAWNDFLGPLIYLTKPSTFTLSLALQFYQSQHGGSEWHLLMAMSVLIILPIVVLFFFTQKTFIQGIATTGMKG